MNSAQYALIGSLGTGLLALLGTIYQGWREDRKRQDDNAQADKKREAKAEALKLRLADDAAVRAEQRAADEKARQRDQIESWRNGLAVSLAEYLAWKTDDEASKRAGAIPPPPPNILTAGWFMELRPYLQRTNDGSLDAAIDDDDIQCDGDTANLLLGEIARIQNAWLGTGHNRMPGRPPRWEQQ